MSLGRFLLVWLGISGLAEGSGLSPGVRPPTRLCPEEREFPWGGVGNRVNAWWSQFTAKKHYRSLVEIFKYMSLRGSNKYSFLGTVKLQSPKGPSSILFPPQMNTFCIITSHSWRQNVKAGRRPWSEEEKKNPLISGNNSSHSYGKRVSDSLLGVSVGQSWMTYWKPCTAGITLAEVLPSSLLSSCWLICPPPKQGADGGSGEVIPLYK